MGYKKATHVLPQHLLRAIQEYVDGEYLYIPRKEENRKQWGEVAPCRAQRAARNSEMAACRKAGWTVPQLAERFFFLKKRFTKFLHVAGKTREHADSVLCYFCCKNVKAVYVSALRNQGAFFCIESGYCRALWHMFVAGG